MTSPYRIFFVLSAVLIFGFGSGCVSQSKYRALESSSNQEITSQRDEIARLKAQKEADNAALAAQKTKITEQQQEIEGLKSEKAETEKRAAELKSQKDEEINRLKGTYDNMVKDLKGEIEKGEIKVTQIRNRLSVNLVEKVLFDSGHAELKSKGKEVLTRVGKILKEIKDKEIRIEGYTDNVPIGELLQDQFPTNWELSTQRATNVLRFLQEETGVDGSRLSAIGYGPFHPVASNDTPKGRAENRRIEILLAPLDTEEVLKSIQ